MWFFKRKNKKVDKSEDELVQKNETKLSVETSKKTTKSAKASATTQAKNKGRNIYYLSARKDSDGKKVGWEVKMENSERASAVLPTKEEALEKVKSLAGKKAATIIIRKVDGSIQETIKFN